MLFAAHDGGLELRRAGGRTRLRGRFPYNSIAVLSDGGRTGRPKKETFLPGAFRHSVESDEQEIHLLVGHSFDQPLASKRNGTLKLADTAAALLFEAEITPAVESISWVADILTAIEAGLVAGVSPGFRIPPQRAVKIAEELVEEKIDPSNKMFGAIIRRVVEAILYELSIVTRPAYEDSQVEMRDWNPDCLDPASPDLHHVLNRWRA